jgi:hypothetical protein
MLHVVGYFSSCALVTPYCHPPWNILSVLMLERHLYRDCSDRPPVTIPGMEDDSGSSHRCFTLVKTWPQYMNI